MAEVRRVLLEIEELVPWACMAPSWLWKQRPWLQELHALTAPVEPGDAQPATEAQVSARAIALAERLGQSMKKGHRHAWLATERLLAARPSTVSEVARCLQPLHAFALRAGMHAPVHAPQPAEGEPRRPHARKLLEIYLPSPAGAVAERGGDVACGYDLGQACMRPNSGRGAGSVNRRSSSSDETMDVERSACAALGRAPPRGAARATAGAACGLGGLSTRPQPPQNSRTAEGEEGKDTRAEEETAQAAGERLGEAANLAGALLRCRPGAACAAWADAVHVPGALGSLAPSCGAPTTSQPEAGGRAVEGDELPVRARLAPSVSSAQPVRAEGAAVCGALALLLEWSETHATDEDEEEEAEEEGEEEDEGGKEEEANEEGEQHAPSGEREAREESAQPRAAQEESEAADGAPAHDEQLPPLLAAAPACAPACASAVAASSVFHRLRVQLPPLRAALRAAASAAGIPAAPGSAEPWQAEAEEPPAAAAAAAPAAVAGATAAPDAAAPAAAALAPSCTPPAGGSLERGRREAQPGRAPPPLSLSPPQLADQTAHGGERAGVEDMSYALCAQTLSPMPSAEGARAAHSGGASGGEEEGGELWHTFQTPPLQPPPLAPAGMHGCAHASAAAHTGVQPPWACVAERAGARADGLADGTKAVLADSAAGTAAVGAGGARAHSCLRAKRQRPAAASPDDDGGGQCGEAPSAKCRRVSFRPQLAEVREFDKGERAPSWQPPQRSEGRTSQPHGASGRDERAAAEPSEASAPGAARSAGWQRSSSMRSLGGGGRSTSRQLLQQLVHARHISYSAAAGMRRAPALLPAHRSPAHAPPADDGCAAGADGAEQRTHAQHANAAWTAQCANPEQRGAVMPLLPALDRALLAHAHKHAREGSPAAPTRSATALQGSPQLGATSPGVAECAVMGTPMAGARASRGQRMVHRASAGAVLAQDGAHTSTRVLLGLMPLTAS